MDKIFSQSVINGVTVYDGSLLKDEEIHKKCIEYYKSKIDKKNFILNTMIPGTVTVQGRFNIPVFNEEELIKLLVKPTGTSIIQIKCNYGTLLNDNFKDYGKNKKPKKAKVEKTNKRKKQGNGDCFNSQITFNILSNATEYKIKMFRNGTITIPGVKKPDLSDIIPALKLQIEYLKQRFHNVSIEFLKPLMRNYKIDLIDSNYALDIDELKHVINSHKYHGRILLAKHLPKDVLDILDCHNCLSNFNIMNIAEVSLQTDKSFILNIKFNRHMVQMIHDDNVEVEPEESDSESQHSDSDSDSDLESQDEIEEEHKDEHKDEKSYDLKLDKDRQATIKAHKTGKINIDGCVSIYDAQELFYWLNYVLYKNPHVLINKKEIQNVSETETSDYDSIYDE